MNTNFKYLLTGGVVTILTMSLLQSCKKETTTTSTDTSTYLMNNTISANNLYAISENYIMALAKRLPLTYMENTEEINYNEEVRNIENIVPIKFDNASVPAAYIVNYANHEGYVVISADSRYEPILAFVKEGNLSLDNQAPYALEEWLGFHTETITNLQNGIIYNQEALQAALLKWDYIDINWGLNEWKNQNHDHTIIQPANPNGSDERHVPCSKVIKGPYLATSWGLFDGFNDDLPSMGCNTSTNRKPPVGCVAVALGQILKYKNAPNSLFNYNLMPTGRNSSNQLREMLMVLGNSNYLNMNYNCNGSWTTGNQFIFALRQLNYTSHLYYSNYSANLGGFNLIKSDIDAENVTFLEGHATKERNKDYTLFKKKYDYYDGHAWLCDGYKIENANCNNKTYYLSMNWGYEEHGSAVNSYNGFYLESTWAPKTMNVHYQYLRKIITNIKP